MKIYTATPINARHEETFVLKCEAANVRCEVIRKLLIEKYPDAEVITPFDVNPIGCTDGEPVALGRCITTVLGCDAVYFDKNWRTSKGCCLEYRAASLYGKTIIDSEVEPID